jgi:hypothetical protein
MLRCKELRGSPSSEREDWWDRIPENIYTLECMNWSSSRFFQIENTLVSCINPLMLSAVRSDSCAIGMWAAVGKLTTGTQNFQIEGGSCISIAKEKSDYLEHCSGNDHWVYGQYKNRLDTTARFESLSCGQSSLAKSVMQFALRWACWLGSL